MAWMKFIAIFLRRKICFMLVSMVHPVFTEQLQQAIGLVSPRRMYEPPIPVQSLLEPAAERAFARQNELLPLAMTAPSAHLLAID